MDLEYQVQSDYLKNKRVFYSSGGFGSTFTQEECLKNFYQKVLVLNNNFIKFAYVSDGNLGQIFVEEEDYERAQKLFSSES
jgi:hypothetical protein